MRPACHIVSKALEISLVAASEAICCLEFSLIVSHARVMTCCVDHCFLKPN